MAEVFKLRKKIHVDGAEVGEMPYDFDAMTARDRMSVSSEMTSVGVAPSGPEEFDPTYHLMLFAKAVEVGSGNKIAVADVLRISAKDAQRAGALARDFFYIAADGGEMS